MLILFLHSGLVVLSVHFCCLHFNSLHSSNLDQVPVTRPHISFFFDTMADFDLFPVAPCPYTLSPSHPVNTGIAGNSSSNSSSFCRASNLFEQDVGRVFVDRHWRLSMVPGIFIQSLPSVATLSCCAFPGYH